MKTITFNEYWSLSPQERDNFTGITDCNNGHVEYHKNGKYHREDGPAVICSDGSEHWYFEGKLHRIDGPAITHTNGSEYWYFEGKQHRIGGPAITYSDGSEFWYFEGKRHRIGGPAFIDKNNKKIIERYWIYGQNCTKEAHDFWVDLMILKELNSKI